MSYCPYLFFSYEVGKSTYPITTRDGMFSRNLQWTETAVARHYAGLASQVRIKDIEPTPLNTVSASIMASNIVHRN